MTAPGPAVTVIMPVRNGERFLRAAVDSVLAQTFTDFELVAIDDGSSDRTAEILAQYTDPRVRVMRGKTSAGPGAARNTGLEVARGRYVAFFDSDDIAAPHRLETQIAWLRAHPQTGFLAAHVALVDEQGAATGPVWGYAGDPALLAPSLLFRNPLPTSTIVVERIVVGDERFDAALTIASDYDMWLRLADRTSIACLPDVLVEYRDHAGNLSHTRQGSADACLERIARRRLARLGLEPSAAELRVHRRLGSRRLDGGGAFLPAAAAWLAKLEAANEARQAFPGEPFRRLLANEWLHVCEAAAREQGCRAWGAMRVSPLLSELVRDRSAWPRLARIPWRSLRTSLRRLRRRGLDLPGAVD